MGSVWVGVHYTRSITPPPWTPIAHDDTRPMLIERLDTPEVFDDVLRAPAEQRTRLIEEHAREIERALRASDALRSLVDTHPQFEIAGENPLHTFALWKHRAVAVLVEDRPPHAVAMAGALWRDSVAATEHCDTLVSCALTAPMMEHALTAAEHVSERFIDADSHTQRRLEELRADVSRDITPNLQRAVEAEYTFAREAIQTTACVPIDRYQTESKLREYFTRMHEFAGGADVDENELAQEPTFSTLYNPCGQWVAAGSLSPLAPAIRRHRETIDALAERRRNLRSRDG